MDLVLFHLCFLSGTDCVNDVPDLTGLHCGIFNTESAQRQGLRPYLFSQLHIELHCTMDGQDNNKCVCVRECPEQRQRYKVILWKDGQYGFFYGRITMFSMFL